MYGLQSGPTLERSASRLAGTVRKLGSMAEATDAGAVADMLASRLKRPASSQLDPLQDGAEPAPLPEGSDAAASALVPSRKTKKGYKRKQSDAPTINNLIKVVERALSLPPGACKQRVCRSEFPEILRSDVLSKWISKYIKYKLWKFPRDIGAKLKAIPNWWIDEQKLSCSRKGRTTIAGIPAEVACLVDRAQAEHTMGSTAATKRADAGQGEDCLRRSLTEAMREYNQAALPLREDIQRQNAEAWKDFKETVEGVQQEEAPTLTNKGAAKLVKQLRAKLRKVPRDFSNWKVNGQTCVRFAAAFRNVRRRTNTQGNFLAYEDPRMQRSRDQHQQAVLDNKIHPGLVLSLGCVSICLPAGVVRQP